MDLFSWIPTSVTYQLVEADAVPPKRAHPTDSGYDLFTYGVQEEILKPGGILKLRTGVKFGIPKGWEAVIKSRSGLAIKGVQAHPGLIDESYRQELHVILYNLGTTVFSLQGDSRVAQICFRPKPLYELVEGTVEDSDRGGFGSTGYV